MEYMCQMGVISDNWDDQFNYVYSAAMVCLFIIIATVTPNIVGFINIIAGLMGCVIFSVTPPMLGV